MKASHAIATALWLLATVATPASTIAAPSVSFNTKAIEATVDVTSLRPYPRLMENCLAEGRRMLAARRGKAEKERRENPSAFAGGGKWSYEVTYALRSAAGRYVSVVRAESSFQGGAHPNTLYDTILWDRSADKRISMRGFFKESSDGGSTMTLMAQLVRLSVAREKMTRNGDDKDGKITPAAYIAANTIITDKIKPSLLKLGPMALAPSTVFGKSSGLTFHFSPYDVGAYAEGPYTAFVGWADFKQALSPEGTAIFAGGRPAGDQAPQ